MPKRDELSYFLQKAAAVCDQGREACQRYILRLRGIEQMPYDQMPYSVYRCRQALLSASALFRYLIDPILDSAAARRLVDSKEAKALLVHDLAYVDTVIGGTCAVLNRADSSVFLSDLCAVQNDVIKLKKRIIKTLETPAAGK